MEIEDSQRENKSEREREKKKRERKCEKWRAKKMDL
jgi:hypothetical protein